MPTLTWPRLALALTGALTAGCGDGSTTADPSGAAGVPGAVGGKADGTDAYNELNTEAARTVLYEVQVRAANACRTDVGADWQRAACAAKVAPEVKYHGPGCDIIDELHAIKHGTLDDMLEDTADYHEGITLRYIHEAVGANMIWLMPLFPNNDRWALPDDCDDTGSPYAVRDYLHVRGNLSRACIEAGRDEYASEPCWANDELETLIQEAHGRGVKVMLDVAFNHFGHNYLFYDYVDQRPTRRRAEEFEDLDALWDYGATFEDALVHPEILDSEDALFELVARDAYAEEDLTGLQARCPDLAGDALVRAFGMWRQAFDGEREAFDCDPEALSLERNVPGFYLGANAFDPAARLGDNFTNNWRDVKFLYHHEENDAHYWDHVRAREYLFRVMNYWVSRGVDGFRLDHATDGDGGMGSNEWKYIIGKVNYYAWKRGQQRPIYLAEEFHDQMAMNHVVDVMIEGYVGDMNGRNGATKDASFVEKVLGNAQRFQGHTYVMRALETHDEHRLTDGTGFDRWTGAGFWGIGAASPGTAMLLMGQEFGEPYGLGFRRSDFLRGRFYGSPNHQADGDALRKFYQGMIQAKLSPANRALVGPNEWNLRPKDAPNKPDSRIFAQARWTDSNVVFTLFNLWRRDVAQTYFLPPDLAGKLSIADGAKYKFVDAFTGDQVGDCRTGADLKWAFPIEMGAETRLQWLRLELCR